MRWSPGSEPFDGEDMTEVLGAIVRLEPKWEVLPVAVPPSVAILVRRCLVKDFRNSIGNIAVAGFVLEHETDTAVAGTQGGRRLSPRRLLAALVAAMTIVVATASGVTWFVNRPLAPRTVRTTLTTGGATALAEHGADVDVAITPDGSLIVYRGRNQLLVRPLIDLSREC